jgi:hypothetical protein
MTEQEMRAIVRDVIARRPGGGAPDLRTSASAFANATADKPSYHSSHALFVLPIGMDSDGPCIIEPAVTCNHCGYCKSYGH